MMWFVTGVLCLLFVKGFAKPRVVPRGLQNVVEVGLDFVRVQIVDEIRSAHIVARSELEQDP